MRNLEVMRKEIEDKKIRIARLYVGPSIEVNPSVREIAKMVGAQSTVVEVDGSNPLDVEEFRQCARKRIAADAGQMFFAQDQEDLDFDVCLFFSVDLIPMEIQEKILSSFFSLIGQGKFRMIIFTAEDIKKVSVVIRDQLFIQTLGESDFTINT